MVYLVLNFSCDHNPQIRVNSSICVCEWVLICHPIIFRKVYMNIHNPNVIVILCIDIIILYLWLFSCYKYWGTPAGKSDCFLFFHPVLRRQWKFHFGVFWSSIFDRNLRYRGKELKIVKSNKRLLLCCIVLNWRFLVATAVETADIFTVSWSEILLGSDKRSLWSFCFKLAL